jgi:hypothetical protein
MNFYQDPFGILLVGALAGTALGCIVSRINFSKGLSATKATRNALIVASMGEIFAYVILIISRYLL